MNNELACTNDSTFKKGDSHYFDKIVLFFIERSKKYQKFLSKYEKGDGVYELKTGCEKFGHFCGSPRGLTDKASVS